MFFSISLLTFFSYLVSSNDSPPPATNDGPIVQDPRIGVSYRGALNGDVEEFQNIFYAEDTSGNNRFAPPVPYRYPPGSIVDASVSGAWCPQATGDPPLPFASSITNISEHCLSLRITRPVGTTASAKLPVVVFIHGGGYCRCVGLVVMLTSVP